MPEPKRALKVFLCHAHSDAAAVRALYSRLKREGVDVWLDKEKLLPGADWEQEIRKAVRESDIVIVCLSKQFNQAGFRQKEVRLALDTAMEQPEGEIFIIPLRLEECENLESLKKWHWVDLFSDDGYQKLIQALRARAEKVDATLRTRRGRKAVAPTTDPVEPALASLTGNAKTNAEDMRNGHADLARSEKTTEKEPRELLSGEPQPAIETSKRSKTIRRKPNTAITVALIGLAGAIFAALLSSSLLEKWLFPPATPTSTLTVTLTSASPTSPITPAVSTSLPTEITDAKGVQMMLVSAGQFTMGHDDIPEWPAWPAHPVYLDDYYIDKYEVTNALYKACVDANACVWPRETNSHTRPSYYEDPAFEAYPVLYVNWNMAKIYCEWRGARLPTEAEWEKAARGVDQRSYPWGDAFRESDQCEQANFAPTGYPCIGGVGDTTEVGSYPTDGSPYGVFDLAGNVWEWVSSLYRPYPYDANDGREELAASGSHVVRGGSWGTAAYTLETHYRQMMGASVSSDAIGFRCALSP